MQKVQQQNLLYRLFVLQEKEFPEDVEQTIFKLITLPNGTTKNTSAQRLDELNVFVLPYLKKFSSLEIKDLAVSSGICTVEWAKFLKENSFEVKITATDLFVNANLLIYSSTFAVLCDDCFNPILVELKNSFYRTSFPKGSLRYYWGKFFSGIFGLFIFQKRKSSLKIQLLASSLKAISGITFYEEDVLSQSKERDIEKYDVIRAANILNKVYFSEVQLKQILSNIAIQLKPSGLLLVSKTDDMGINHATIFRKTKNGFSLLSKLNSGSEITDLALQLFF